MVGKERNFGLDIIRAISIIFVLTAHISEIQYELGIVGVQFFFVLSGFLIGQILIRDFNEGSNQEKLITFWKRRWWRTLPLYYLILVLKILVYGNPYGWKMIVYFLFLQANFVGIGFFGVSWTLVVEEWFYIFLPVAAVLVFRSRIVPIKFLWFLVILILFFLSARFVWNYYEKGIIVYQFDCLLLGVVLAALKIYYNKMYLKISSPVLMIAGSLSVAFFTISAGSFAKIGLYDTYYRVLWYFFISISIALVIPFVERSQFINTQLRSYSVLYFIVTWTSVLTYSIYLIHMDVLKFSYLFIPEEYALISAIILIYLSSILLYVFFEHPMMSMRDVFSMRQYKLSVKANLSASSPFFSYRKRIPVQVGASKDNVKRTH